MKGSLQQIATFLPTAAWSLPGWLWVLTPAHVALLLVTDWLTFNLRYITSGTTE